MEYFTFINFSDLRLSVVIAFNHDDHVFMRTENFKNAFVLKATVKKLRKFYFSWTFPIVLKSETT